jgi:hypothetical protein
MKKIKNAETLATVTHTHTHNTFNKKIKREKLNCRGRTLGDPENKYNKKHNVVVEVLGDSENKKRKIKQNVGAGLVSAHAITLITLVITIVILIILAGITINLALRDNGLIEKIKQAKNDLEISEGREDIQLAYLRSNR